MDTPSGDEWVHELNFNGYRTHARLDWVTYGWLSRIVSFTGEKDPSIAAGLLTLSATGGSGGQAGA